MDRQTLSQYGWIVIVVLVLAILLGMATPFGNTISAAVKDNVSVMEQKSDNVLDDAFNGKDTTLTPVEPANLFEGSTWVFGKGVHTQGYGDVASNKYASTSFIETSSNNSYVVRCEFNNEAYKQLVVYFYSEEKNSTIIKGSNLTLSTSRCGSWNFTVPENENIKYMRFSLYSPTTETEDSVKPVSTKLFLVSDLQNNGFKLAGKTILNFGDSIAYGATLPSYGHIIAKNNYMDIDNDAVSGSTFAVLEGNTKNILNQVNSASESIDPDYILMNGSINDAVGSITIGAISDTKNSELDTSTFCGGFEATVKAIKEKYPNAKIIFVTTHLTSQRDKTKQNNLYNLELEMCEKWGVTVADVHNTEFNTFIDEYVQYTSDGLHPNTEGYGKFYVPVVEATIKELSK